MKNWEKIILGALGIGAVYVGYKAYKDYQSLTNGIKNITDGISNAVNTVTNPISYTNGPLANPVSQAGSTAVILTDLPSNYQGATITYGTTTASTQAALAKQTEAFQSGSKQASVVISNTGVVSTYGGAIANPLPTSGVGSPSNPYLFKNGYKGAGSYQVSKGSPIITITSQSSFNQEIADINAGMTVAPQGGGVFNWL